MRIIKKILRIIAILLPVICCCFINSGDSLAKSWSIPGFRSHGINTINQSGNMVTVAERPILYFDSTEGLSFIHDTYFTSTRSDGKCQFASWSSSGNYIGQREVDFGSSFILPIVELYDRSSVSDIAWCRNYSTFGGTFGNFSLPKYNRFSTPPTYQLDLNPLLPYSYDYGTLTETNPTNFITSDNFDISRLQGISLPIDFGAYEDLSAGTSVIFDLDFYFTQSDFTEDFIQSGSVELVFRGVINDEFVSSVTRCERKASRVNYRCSVPIERNFSKYMYGFTIRIGWPTGVQPGPLFVESPLKIVPGRLVLNDDFSLSTESGGFLAGGNNVNSVPVLPPEDTSNDSWFNQIIGLFNFNIINPFNSIFNMFINTESCSHIPIIAGMLHAESDLYCPWFPSTVRQVLTPVFSISATMLLFGFFVSFLKSSSGNDTIDGPGHGSVYKGRLS